MSPVRYNAGGSGGGSLPSGTADFNFAEDATADDQLGIVTAFPDDVEVGDALGGLVVATPDNVDVNDTWNARAMRTEWAEDASANDQLSVVPAFPEDAEVADLIGLLRANLNDDASVDDLLGLRANLNDDASVDDLGKYRITNMTYGRSGTPDSDASGDAWVDKAAQTTNHGNEALSVNGEVVNTEKRGLLFFDFTRYAGVTALTGGTHTFVLFVSHSAAAGANNLRVRMSTLAAKPFVESTVTWDSPLADGGGPAEGTLRVNAALAVAAGAAAAYTITLTDAEVNNLLGQWVYVRLLSEATLAATVFTVVSREGATVSQRPTFALTLKR